MTALTWATQQSVHISTQSIGTRVSILTHFQLHWHQLRGQVARNSSLLVCFIRGWTPELRTNFLIP